MIPSAQEVMPYLYPLLSLEIFYISLLWMIVHRYRKSPAAGALSVMLVFHGIAMMILSLTTGPYAILSINEFRSYIVAARSAELVVGLVECVLLTAIVMGYRNNSKQMMEEE